MLASKPACFFERKRQDFTRYFQSLDTNSCELIVIDRAGGHIFAQRRPRTLSNGKSAKVLFMANCGIRVAMDIGVSCDHVSRFNRYFWHAGYDVWKRVYVQTYGVTIGPLRRSERVRDRKSVV